MECRAGCGACCIAPSISSPIPGMPETYLCRIWCSANYPDVCRRFTAAPETCGESREDALGLIASLEEETR